MGPADDLRGVVDHLTDERSVLVVQGRALTALEQARVAALDIAISGIEQVVALLQATDISAPMLVELEVARAATANPGDLPDRWRAHVDRAEALHDLLGAGGLSVQDWGETDAAPNRSTGPPEDVFVHVAVSNSDSFVELVRGVGAEVQRGRVGSLVLQPPNVRSTGRKVGVVVREFGGLSPLRVDNLNDDQLREIHASRSRTTT